MPDTKILVWMDFETTGLLEDPTPPTALEAAWTITDPYGRQLIGLSQVYCALPLHHLGNARTPNLADDSQGRPVGYWDTENYPPSRVQEMHAANGLTTDWATAESNRPHRILRDWAELERLLLDDLHLVGWPGLGLREIQLAGGGVAHFEHRFLTEMAPRVFGDPRFHYRTVDMSEILGGLHLRIPAIPGKADEVIAAMGPDIPDDPANRASAERAGWSQVMRVRERYDASTWGPFADMEADDHRAATGVARALMAYRLLPDLLRLHAPVEV